MREAEQPLGDRDIERLKEALSKSYKECFLMATRLYKIQQTMSKAQIRHKPFINKSGS